MVVQLIDLENFEAQLARRLERYQQRYKITHAELAWILLRIGTSYYFKDICSRELNGGVLVNDNGGHS